MGAIEVAVPPIMAGAPIDVAGGMAVETAGAAVVPVVDGAGILPVPDDDAAAVPVAIVVEPRADGKPDAEAQPEVVRAGSLDVDDLGLVNGHVHDLGVGRQDLDLRVVDNDGLLRAALEVAEIVGFAAEALHAVHHVVRLVDEGLADLRGPLEVFIHPGEEGGNTGDGFDAIVPRLGFDEVGAGGVGADEARGEDDLRGQGRGGEDLGEERIGVQGDGAEQGIELCGGAQRGLVGGGAQ